MIQAWTTVSTREVFRTAYGLSVTCEEVLLPDGRIVPDYYQISVPSHVTVYSLTSAGEVICLRQYKHGPRRVVLTLPGGLVDEQEEPLKAAQRELLEETGYVCREWRCLGSFTVGGNQGIAIAYLYMASGAKKVRSPHSGDLEDMSLELHSQGEVRAEMAAGNFPILAHTAAIALANFDSA